LAESKELKRKQDDAAAAQEAAREQNAAKAKDKANRMWSGAEECVEHPYLTTKKVSACGSKVLYGRLLTVPMRDVDGNLHSLQMITPDGSKRYLLGGAVSEHFHRIDGDDRICICE